MKWKESLIGAFVGIVVSVVSGVAIYYLTREPTGVLDEDLEYNVDAPVTFRSNQTQFSITNIHVRNVGNASATNTVIGVEFAENIKLLDHQTVLSSGPGGKFEAENLGNTSMQLRVPVLAPTETVKLAILTDLPGEDAPVVGVKSDRSIGLVASEKNGGQSDAESQINVASGIFVPLAVITQILLALVVILMRRRLVRFSRSIFPHSRSENDTAFVLLHGGLLDEASRILDRSIIESGGEPCAMANYGLALGLMGQQEKSEKFLDAAEFWADNHGHSQAIVSFNRAILCFHNNNGDEGVVLMRRALALSNDEICRYLNYSTLVQQLRVRSPDLHSLLDEFGVPKNKKSS